MNVITHNKAYALYPKGTFEERRSLVYSKKGLKQDDARKKYEMRGWSMVKHLTVEEFKDRTSAFAPGIRYVGDSKCWTVPVYPTLDLPEGFIETNTWALQYSAKLVPTMSFRTLRVDCLNFSYLVANESLVKYMLPALFPTSESKEWVQLQLHKVCTG